MKFSCKTKDILEGVQIVANLCQARTTKPVLQCIKIQVEKNELLLLGTDMEVAMRFWLRDLDIQEEGVALLPSQKLLSMLREIDDEITSFNSDQSVCMISTSNAKFKLISDDPDEFPMIPEYDLKDALEINGGIFKKFAGKTLFAVARDMSCYAYNGVLIEVYENGIKFVATDGRRLSLAGNVDRDQINVISSSVVPIKGVSQLIKSIEEEESSILIKIVDNQFIMRTDRVEVASRLLEGDFPDYREAVPKDNHLCISIEKELFSAALRKVSITAGSEVRSVLFEFKKGMLNFFSQQEGIGESESSVPVDFSDKEFKITFNPDFIMDYLKVMTNDNVKLYFKDEESSCLIEDSDQEFYIVMPITK